eukprot:CAMPEP_0183345736 /NCGR_PEP_ID=MMETSP0164_2-20130417/11079_1 /TAXON_ID=221442 /ORGANISM="Coccolithus pelagicus ssp braarudi, Strain PLY182g" /LENGTH=66 /DNA_ID=CAMNT_0025516919 /DNA_START=264 /DNA_END=461 /DNA_ORIENTATION=-
MIQRQVAGALFYAAPLASSAECRTNSARRVARRILRSSASAASRIRARAQSSDVLFREPPPPFAEK